MKSTANFALTAGTFLQSVIFCGPGGALNDLNIMRLRHIEIFYAVYVTGSVSGAAKSLNVSQPTVSKILRHAEDKLGFLLFHREKGRLIPSEKADLLYEQVLPVYESLARLRKFSASLAETGDARLRIAMTPAFSLEVGPRALAEFCANHPDVYVEVETQHSEDIRKLLLHKAIDLGIVYEAGFASELVARQIGVTEFVCVSPKSFDIHVASLKLKELCKYPLIQLNAKSPLGKVLENSLKHHLPNPPKNLLVAETYHLAKRLSAQGAGLAIIDRVTAVSGRNSNLNIHTLDELDPIEIHIVMRK